MPNGNQLRHNHYPHTSIASKDSGQPQFNSTVMFLIGRDRVAGRRAKIALKSSECRNITIFNRSNANAIRHATFILPIFTNTEEMRPSASPLPTITFVCPPFVCAIQPYLPFECRTPRRCVPMFRL